MMDIIARRPKHFLFTPYKSNLRAGAVRFQVSLPGLFSMDLKKLYRELVRRNVFRAVVAYLAVAWVLVQIADTIFPAFDAPAYLMQGLIYLLAIGLLIWTAFSWIYDMTPEGIQKTSEADDLAQTRNLNNRRLNAVIVGAGIAAVLLLLAGSFWAGSQWNRGIELVLDPEYRIAVLPFEDRSNNPDFNYLQEGLAEEVIGKLVNSKALSVIASKSSFQFYGTEVPLGQISQSLQASLILTGSYAVTGQHMLVKIELIRTEDQEILNYASISGDLAHIQEVSSKIQTNIFQALDLSEGEVRNSPVQIRDVNVEAYKYNALGMSAMRDNTGQKLEEITRYFQAAIDLDPNYMQPYIGMAEAYIFDVNRGYISATEGAKKARQYVLEAEKLNPGCGEVSGILGIIHFLEFDFKNAVPYFERSLEKSPNFSLAYHWYAFTLEFLGDFDRAEELQKRAGILDPLNAMNDTFLTLNYIYQDRFSDARELIESKLAVDPGHKQTLWLKAVMLTEQGRFQEAHNALVKRGVGLETNFVSGYVFAKLGQEERARQVLNNMLGSPFVSPSQLAIVYCGLGANDQALDQVEEAFLTHDSWFGWLVFTSMADGIKDDPRFVALTTRLGL